MSYLTESPEATSDLDRSIGAATSAIGQRDNAFKNYYQRMLSHGITPANAKHSVARKMVLILSAMWKTSACLGSIIRPSD